MESQQFILSNYINDSLDYDKLLEKLHSNGIRSKDYPDYNMTVLYNKYEVRNKSPLQMECRSVVIDRTNKSIICYSCPTPIYNIDAVNYMWRNQKSPKETYVCYEGSLLSLFNNNENWYVASRKCIYNKDSDETSQFKMFMDVLRKDGHSNLDSFTNTLDKDRSYHFVLIHHENENVVNYKKQFGDNYTKLCLIFTRNIKNHMEYDINESNCITSGNIFIPSKIEDVDSMQEEALKNISEAPSTEGIIIRMNGKILKLQTSSYQFHKAIGSEKNMYRGFISLYQNNSLKQYFENNTNMEKFRKITNPLKVTESYDTIGIIDAVFKVCTSELLYLFNLLYDTTGTPTNKTLYNILPNEYKNMLFHVRGIFIQNKKKGTSWPPPQNHSFLRISEIYNLLKTIDVTSFENFIRMRKLMMNWVRLEESNNNDLQLFHSTFYHNDKIFYKLSSIYTIKLFPDIMPDNIPGKDSNLLNKIDITTI
jgi:hypothetical protein